MQLVRPEPTELTFERSYRFGHILIRDAAYRGLLKRSRAVLHERFVAWADRVNQDRDRAVEYEEILGYHLEQATAASPSSARSTSTGASSGSGLRLASSSAGAGHLPAGTCRRPRTSFVERRAPPRRRASTGYALARPGRGDDGDREFAWAETSSTRRSRRPRRRRGGLAASARLLRMRVRSHSAEPEDWTEQMVAEAERGLPLLEAAGDHVEAARAFACLPGRTGQPAGTGRRRLQPSGRWTMRRSEGTSGSVSMQLSVRDSLRSTDPRRSRGDLPLPSRSSPMRLETDGRRDS